MLPRVYELIQQRHTVPGGKRNLSAIGRVQLLHDVADMHLHRAFRDRQLVGNDLVRLAESQQTANVGFAAGEQAGVGRVVLGTDFDAAGGQAVVVGGDQFLRNVDPAGQDQPNGRRDDRGFQVRRHVALQLFAVNRSKSTRALVEIGDDGDRQVVSAMPAYGGDQRSYRGIVYMGRMDIDQREVQLAGRQIAETGRAPGNGIAYVGIKKMQKRLPCNCRIIDKQYPVDRGLRTSLCTVVFFSALRIVRLRSPRWPVS